MPLGIDVNGRTGHIERTGHHPVCGAGAAELVGLLTGHPARSGIPASGPGVFADLLAVIGVTGLKLVLYWLPVILVLIELGIGNFSIQQLVQHGMVNARLHTYTNTGTESARDVSRLASRSRASILCLSPTNWNLGRRAVGYLLEEGKDRQA